MSTSTRFRLPALALGVLALALAAPRASAQCPGPDGLNSGPCCSSVTPSLPSFPQAGVPARGIRWNACTVGSTENLRVEWTPPAQVGCTSYVAQLTVRDASGAAVLGGSLNMDYTRTWEEFSFNAPTQVWRFAVKVDLSAVAGVPISPGVLPTCLSPTGPYATAFYYGYVDYANCDPTQPWANVLVLYHAYDTFIHRPAISDKPGAFHPTDSYAIVAPHTSAQQFLPGFSGAPGGSAIGSTRNIGTGMPTLCSATDPGVSGMLVGYGNGCIATGNLSPAQHTARHVKGTTACVNASGVAGSFTSVNFYPGLPWAHNVSTSMGAWLSPFSYPGAERAWVDEGVYAVGDACSGDFAEFKYGGSTDGGWSVLSPPGPSRRFLDLTDNYTTPLFGPYPTPYVGSVYPSNHVLTVHGP